MSHDAPCNGIKSIEVGSRLLFALTASPEPLPLRELARRARMNPSKAHRYLTSYIAVGFVEQDAISRKYRLGAFACQMGLAAASRSEPLGGAIRIARKLLANLNETVFLTVWGTQGAAIVHQEVPRKSIVITMPVGYILPLTRSAAGRVFLAHLPQELTAPFVAEEQRLYRSAGPCQIDYWHGNAKSSPACFDIVTSIGSIMSGISAMATPLFDEQENLIAVLAVMGAENSLDLFPKGEPALALAQAARQFRQSGHPIAWM